ncbi:MAG TPA: hypothetical protein VJ302_04410 [Blastocatellia bacterium]|nr:hypothetical protein [Blastocatellia bacterium]
MIKYGTILAAIIAAVAMAGLRPAETAAAAGHGTSQPPATLLSLLAETGNSYNRYFTIESAWKDGEAINKMESTVIEPPSIPASEAKNGLQLTLDALKQKVSNLTFIQNPSNDRIIHVIDSRLLKQDGYGLSHTVKNLEFSGTVEDLLKSFRAQGIPVGPPTSLSLHEMLFYDAGTPVEVKGRNSQVRTLLSNCLPLEGRSRILWVARTRLGQGEVSQVQFIGARKQS